MPLTCAKCNGDAYTSFYQHATGQWVCKSCYDAPPLAYDPSVQITWDDGKGSITVGHLKDIQRRRIGPDGKIYRDFGRKTI